MKVGVQQSAAEAVGAVALRPPQATTMAKIGRDIRRNMGISVGAKRLGVPSMSQLK
jgi:hypothetical protein